MPVQTPAWQAALQISRRRFDRPQDARGPRTHRAGTAEALGGLQGLGKAKSGAVRAEP